MEFSLIKQLIYHAYLADKQQQYKLASDLDRAIIKLAQTDQLDFGDEPTFTKEYDIPEDSYPALEELVNKMNKKIQTINARKEQAPLELTTYKITKRYTKTVKKQSQDPEILQMFLYAPESVVPMLTVEVFGMVPRINGWSFVARILHGQDDAGKPMNTFMLAPGQVIPPQYKDALPHCEHCNTTRRRNDTFIIKDEQEQYKQIGSSCLAEFLNTRDIHSMLWLLEAYQDLEDRMGGDGDYEERFGRGSRNLFSTEGTLKLMATITKLFGYTSVAKADEMRIASTIHIIQELLSPGERTDNWHKRMDPYINKLQSLTPEDKQHISQFTENAIEYIKSLKDKENPTDFEWNLSASMHDALNKKYVDPRRMGILCYFAAAYQRHMDGEQKQLADKKDKLSTEQLRAKYPVGAKITADVTLVKKYPIESQYGVSIIHMFKDAENTSFKWFASGGVELADEGDELDISGTVKGIDEYKGNPSVQLLRVKSKRAPELRLERDKQQNERNHQYGNLSIIIGAMNNIIYTHSQQGDPIYKEIYQKTFDPPEPQEWIAIFKQYPQAIELQAEAQKYMQALEGVKKVDPTLEFLT
jgi:hypothetical protein